MQSKTFSCLLLYLSLTKKLIFVIPTAGHSLLPHKWSHEKCLTYKISSPAVSDVVSSKHLHDSVANGPVNMLHFD